jgi:hypothetical protein
MSMLLHSHDQKFSNFEYLGSPTSKALATKYVILPLYRGKQSRSECLR